MPGMIPYLDLKAQHADLMEEITAAISRVFDSTQFVLGEEVEAFEQEFAAYLGVGHAIAVNSGTSALHLALLASGIGAGDEVITVPFTFVATVAAICYTGARPVFVDIDPRSYTIAVDRIADAITPRTRAIIPVHLYGQPADMDPVVEIASRHGLEVIEDAAQAHAAEYKGRRAGSLGDLACFSFYPGKNLGACGEGGIVVTNDGLRAQTIRQLRDWGQDRKYHHVLRGFNYRMDGIQGAILRVKLRHLDRWTTCRRTRAAQYNRLLDDAVITPLAMSYARHAYHVYAVRWPDRDGLQQTLRSWGVQTAIHYPVPVHLQPAYADLGYSQGRFPHAEQAAREVLSLPMYPDLTNEQVERVSAAVRLGVDVYSK
jgi:dTDP-4-amino-4,6-dideoxygalactose transaminase